MNSWKRYHRPHTMTEALSLLEHYGKDAAVVAGGTDLILDLEFQRKKAVSSLVDITFVKGIDRIEVQDSWIVIGAAATHAAISSHPHIRLHATALATGSGKIGGPQVRNVATIGGNLAHALPAADGTTALMSLDAQILVHSSKEAIREGKMNHWKPLNTLFAGPGKNTLKTGELLEAVRIPLRPGPWGSAFDRVMRPQGTALPMLGFSASVELEGDSDDISSAALCFGPAGPVPFRASQAENTLIGLHPGEPRFEEAVAAAMDDASFRTSRHRATARYRREILEVLMRRVVKRAWENAVSTRRQEETIHG